MVHTSTLMISTKKKGDHVAKVARRTISIPEDLDKRMDKATQTEDVNWPHVAASAFELKLAEIAAKKKEQTMDDVVQRLRASRMESADKDYKAGYDAGVDWAKRSAEWRDLEKLAKVYAKHDFEDLINDEEHGGLRFLILTDDPAGANAEYWQDQFGGEENPPVPEVLGFWEGALQVYKEVKDKI